MDSNETVTSYYFPDSVNGTGNRTETLEHLNARYAKALLPLTVTFGVFTFLGVLGNSIILLVFSLSRDYRRNNFKVFVLTLAVIDLIICVTLLPAEMVKQRHYFSFGDAVSCKVKCFFNVFGASSSCLALLVISVDRYRKVVQPFRKQLTPRMAVRILFVVAFLFPIALAVPGTMMCGIKTTDMSNVYGGHTTIYLCETEDQYRNSTWRLVYKWVFVSLMVIISLTYIILYTFVMKEAAKQIRSMAAQRKNSTYDVSYSSGIYDPNTIVQDPPPLHLNNINNIKDSSNKLLSPSGSSSRADLQNGHKTCRNGSNGLIEHPTPRSKKVSKQFSLRSMKSQSPMLHRQGFPTKTLIWFTLTLVFIISYMTHLILALRVSTIIRMAPGQFSSFSFFYRIYFFNHMINPVVYAIFVKRFRMSCRTLLPTLKRRLVDCCRR